MFHSLTLLRSWGGRPSLKKNDVVKSPPPPTSDMMTALTLGPPVGGPDRQEVLVKPFILTVTCATVLTAPCLLFSKDKASQLLAHAKRARGHSEAVVGEGAGAGVRVCVAVVGEWFGWLDVGLVLGGWAARWCYPLAPSWSRRWRCGTSRKVSN